MVSGELGWLEDMPRRHGLDLADVFHVFNRGVDRQDIFTADDDQYFFEHLLAEMVERCGVKLHAYALMMNHFHMLIEARGAALSEAMHLVGRAYATWQNRVGGRTGPLFESRFKAIPILDGEMLTTEGRYVHRNPISLVPAAALQAYRFSSLPVYVGRRASPSWLSTERLLGEFTGTADEYRRFVERPLRSDVQKLGPRPSLVELSIGDVERAIVEALRVDQSTLFTSSQGVRNDARLLAVTIAAELRAASTSELAHRYGFGDDQQVRATASRGRRQVKRREALAVLHARVLDRLIAP